MTDRVLELDLLDALGQFRGIDGDFTRLGIPGHALVVGLHVGDVRGTAVFVLENAVVVEQVGSRDGHGASALGIELVIAGLGVTEVVLRDRDLALVILVDADDARLVGVGEVGEHTLTLGVGHVRPDSGGGPAVVVIDDEHFVVFLVEVRVRRVAGLYAVVEDAAVVVGVGEVALEVDPVDELLDIDIAWVRCRVIPAAVSIVSVIPVVATGAIVAVIPVIAAAWVVPIVTATGIVAVVSTGAIVAVIPATGVVAVVASVVSAAWVVIVSTGAVVPIIAVVSVVGIVAVVATGTVVSVIAGVGDVVVTAAAVVVVLGVGHVLAVGIRTGILVLGLVVITGCFRVAGSLGGVITSRQGCARGFVRVRTRRLPVFARPGIRCLRRSVGRVAESAFVLVSVGLVLVLAVVVGNDESVLVIGLLLGLLGDLIFGVRDRCAGSDSENCRNHCRRGRDQHLLALLPLGLMGFHAHAFPFRFGSFSGGGGS